MPVQLQHHPDRHYLEVRMTGKLTKHDYETFGPEVEQLIKQHGKLRLLVELHAFEGWTFGGVWEDIKFDVKHFNDVERLAIVGEKSWQKGMAQFCKPFTTANIRYFEPSEVSDAREWLAEQ